MCFGAQPVCTTSKNESHNIKYHHSQFRIQRIFNENQCFLSNFNKLQFLNIDNLDLDLNHTIDN